MPVRIHAIVFDLDGTLIQLAGGNAGGRVAEWLEPLAPFLPGRDAKGAARRLLVATETPGNYTLATLERLGLEPLYRPALDWLRRAKGISTLERFAAIDGAEEVLAELSARMPLGVLTNRARREAHGFVEKAGLARHFKTVVSRQDVTRLKPHPDALRHAARGLGVAVERVVMVGDMAVDMQAARRAGAIAVGVLTGFSSEFELRSAGAHTVLASVTGLPAWLAGG